MSKSESDNQIIEGALALLLLVIAIPFIIALNGYTFSVLWEWFLVPIFQLEPITVLEAAGLSMVIGFLRLKATGGKKDEEPLKSVLLYVFAVAIGNALSLFFGWIVHALMK